MRLYQLTWDFPGRPTARGSWGPQTYVRALAAQFLLPSPYVYFSELTQTLGEKVNFVQINALSYYYL